ncbi:MAG TPA: serine hydrolase domain-containing protein [Bryobacteraceae bacterium]|nr:serine hydrolase domain-containing protein [Bryobacteraceae bacterium]
MRNRMSSVLTCLFVVNMAWAQSAPLAQEFDQKIAAALAAAGAPSVSVAVIRDGQAIYTRAFGKADIAKERAATVATRYAVGSISKQFTAAGLLLQQEQGKLSLDDKVSKYYPDLTRAGEVTIRELLSHTSGYEDYAPQDYLIPEWTHAITPDEILNRWAKKPLNFDPGTQWQYSNTNFVLAGKILEKVSGQELLPFLQQHFFEPLGMSSAGDCEVHNPADATSYTRYALGPPRQVGREAAGWYFAAGELCMTAADLAKWDMNFLQKKILSAKSYEEFTREVKLKDGRPAHYALGLSVSEFHGTPLISHTGEVSGFLAANSVLPAKNAAVVVLSNEDGVNLIGPLSQMVRAMLVDPPNAAAERQDRQVRQILEALQEGRIDRSLLTANADSYFSDTALNDYRNSLEPLGKLQLLTRQDEGHRGGMAFLSYRAHFEKNSVAISIYMTPDGKFEQFLVEEQL